MRTRLHFAVATGAAALLLPISAASAHATAPARSGLPPIGAEIPSSMLAINSALAFGDAVHSLDFRGGIKQRVDVNPEDPLNSVRLRTVGFRVSAEDASGRTYVIEQADVDVEAKSTLRLTQRFPPRFEERDVIPVTLHVDKGGEEEVLPAKEPMVLTATLTQYPARGDMYRLEKPVEFASPEKPGKVVARLVTFNAKRGGL